MGWLTNQINEDDDMTMRIIKALAAAAAVCIVILVLFVLWSVYFSPPRAAQKAAAFHNEVQFAKLQAKHGAKAATVVVYEENGRAYYYPNGPAGERAELK